MISRFCGVGHSICWVRWIPGILITTALSGHGVFCCLAVSFSESISTEFLSCCKNKSRQAASFGPIGAFAKTRGDRSHRVQPFWFQRIPMNERLSSACKTLFGGLVFESDCLADTQSMLIGNWSLTKLSNCLALSLSLLLPWLPEISCTYPCDSECRL